MTRAWREESWGRGWVTTSVCTVVNDNPIDPPLMSHTMLDAGSRQTIIDDKPQLAPPTSLKNVDWSLGDDDKGVCIATQLNSTQLTQLNGVKPSQSCFCLWRHDLQTESTGSLRSLIGDGCSRCERVDNSTSSSVELSCVAINTP